MKNITNILTIIAACLLMGACSSDKLPFENEKMAQQSDTDSPVYFCMQLNQQDKSNNESKINEAIILFFNIDGKQWYGAKCLKFDESTQGKSKIIMTLPNIQARPYELLVVANPVEDVKHALLKTNTQVAEWLDKSDIMKLTAKLAPTPSEKEYFMMSTAQYVMKDGSQNFGTKITEDYFKPTKEEALQHPIELNIERVHAKVKVDASKINEICLTSSETEIQLDGYRIDGQTRTISWLPMNLWLSNIPDRTYVVKKLTGEEGTQNYDDSMSSKWAVSPKSTTYSNSKFITTNESFNTLLTKYILENTTPVVSNHSSVCISGRLIVDNKKQDLYRLHGELYTEKGIKQLLNRYVEDNTNLTFKRTKVEGGSTYERYVSLQDNSGEDKIKFKVSLYSNGDNYYFANIPHIDNKFGVVRNHFYKLEVTKISGLGTPVADEEEIIIPKHPEDDNSVMSIKVNVLPWHEVNEDIGFGNK